MDEFFEYYEKHRTTLWDMDGHARRFFRYLAAQPPMIEQLVCSPSFYDFGERIYATQMNRLSSLRRRAVLARGITSNSEELICALIRNMAWNATANGCARERSFPWKRRPRFSAP